MAKLFVAVVPNSECDKRTKFAVEMAEIFDCESAFRPEPEDHDANYYEVCFGSNVEMARTMLEYVEIGPGGINIRFMNDPIMMSVYGLYRAEILSDDMTLEQFIEKEAG